MSSTIEAIASNLKPFETLEEVVEGLERIMAEMTPPDKRVIFLKAYLVVCYNIVKLVKADYFIDSKWVSKYCAVFGEQYRQAILNYERKNFDAVAEVWRIAFDKAFDATLLMPQHLALGMNAHLGRDLPYAISKIDFDKNPERYQDHNRVNASMRPSIIESQKLLCKIYPRPIRLFCNLLRPVFVLIGMKVFLKGREKAWQTGSAKRYANEAEQEQIWEKHERDALRRAKQILAITARGPLGRLRYFEQNRII